VGSTAWNLYRNLDLNQLQAGTLQAHPGVNVNALRPYPGYSDITQYTTGSNSNYNSLQIQVRKQFNGGGLINAAYTWSKSIDTWSTFSSRPMDSYNARGDRGLSDFDRRHMFVLTYVYPLPFWQAQNNCERYVNTILSCEASGGSLKEWDGRRKKTGRGGVD
jgi:hypothetical protein